MNPAAIATEPLGTATLGVGRRGTSRRESMPLRYANARENPRNATVYDRLAWQSITSETDIDTIAATSLRSRPSYTTGTSWRGDGCFDTGWSVAMRSSNASDDRVDFTYKVLAPGTHSSTFASPTRALNAGTTERGSSNSMSVPSRPYGRVMITTGTNQACNPPLRMSNGQHERNPPRPAYRRARRSKRTAR